MNPSQKKLIILSFVLIIAIGSISIQMIYQSSLVVHRISSKFFIQFFVSQGSNSSAIDSERQKANTMTKENRLRLMRSAARGNRLAELQTYVMPQLNCSTMVRVGNMRDGGKWICNPWRVSQNDCVIYSLGVNGDVSFETGIYEATGSRCRIYSMDVGAQNLKLFEPFDGVFVQGKMTGSADLAQNETSVAELMRQFNHTRVDILKMDIEGWEFDSLNGFFNDSRIDEKQTSVCQILVEIHPVGDKSTTIPPVELPPLDAQLTTAWFNLLEHFEKKGFRMFSKEVNEGCPRCFEFGYIHLACMEEYGLSKDAVFTLYFD